MSWYIQSNLNDGYPTNTGFPESIIQGFTNNVNNVWYPADGWRIDPNYNDGYPWIWWHLAMEDGWYFDGVTIGSYASKSTGGGQMDIGGRQTNYPNGFHTISNSNIAFDGHGQEFHDNPSAGGFLAEMNNMYACTPTSLMGLVNSFKDAVSSNDLINIRSKINETLGANIFDTITIAKLFPFKIPANSTPEYILYACAGLIEYDKSDDQTSSGTGFYKVTNTCVLLDFGDITPGITQGWEIETIDWSIYLPYCGSYPLDIRSNETINLKCVVDLMSGVCEYFVLLKKGVDHNGDIIFSATGKMGTDIPINMNNAKLASNMQGWKNVLIGKGLELGGTAMSAIPGFGLGGGLVSGVGSAIGSAIPAHQTLTAPTFGGGLSFAAPTNARIIGRRPIIQKDAMGYPELLGLTHDWKVDKVVDVGKGNYTEFNNYKCDIIMATTAEKAEIEKLMNSGVFV